MATVQIKRDAFARMTLLRTSTRAVECAWCGTTPKYRSFHYWWMPDTVNMVNTRMADALEFCSIGCWRSYHA